jgi:hypothetical protein
VSNHDPFQSLPARLAGLTTDDTLHDGVPAWLANPLREWLLGALDHDEGLARRMFMRLRWTPAKPDSSYISALLTRDDGDLLTAIDAVLQLNSGLWQHVEFLKLRPDIRRTDPVTELVGILTDGGSRYTVDGDRRCLTVRLDPTVSSAANMAVAGDPTAGDHLRAAWSAAYGLAPDPDKAYDEAVLAVEALACPLVCPSNPRRTLGRVIADLDNQRAQWGLTVCDSTGQPADPGPLIEMLKLLWQGQSRHAGSPNSRRQTPAEAEAAVHLAATLVQWLTSGVLYGVPVADVS